eukprot:TRINITY_DN3793_c0_g1_i1.p1 TRINITY_DN3793_c0_g1~~TRINITY_DN3793_c0_g1_i1.p1  ORF type:complete len:438 (-),score=105.44 TRINITY_DN3793_c0_g1_i1:211-1524(-)
MSSRPLTGNMKLFCGRNFGLLVVCFLLYCVCVAQAFSRRGINPVIQGRYSGSEFMCFDRSKVVPSDHINDDYCDCNDGSDEPGTSACSRGRFFCGRERGSERYVSASQVDDGVCDCCSGADEPPAACRDRCDELEAAWRQQLAAEAKVHLDGVKLKRQYVKRAKRAVPELRQQLLSARRELELAERALSQHSGGSGDRAGHRRREAHSKAQRSQQHVALLQRLLRTPAADDASNADDAAGRRGGTEFGASNEFAPLFGRCFEWSGQDRQFKGGSYDVPPGNYTFELCPFASVGQTRIDRPAGDDAKQTLLGVWAGWATAAAADDSHGQQPLLDGGQRLVMTYTHGEPCWQGPNRFVQVVLECAADDRLRLVKEDGKCLYTMWFTTPAACSYQHAQVLLAKAAGPDADHVAQARELGSSGSAAGTSAAGTTPLTHDEL